MKAQQHELDLINREGYEYHIKARRGWYYKGQWIGYNVQDAFEDRANRSGYYNEGMERRRIQSS
ncbi:hypothetical protein ES708_11540 [subsurface metagenome]